MKHQSKRGVSLMVVLPIVLFLFLLGYVFIESVLLYTHQNEIHLQSSQLKYASIAVRELAMLEIVEAGSMTTNVKKNQTKIDIELDYDIPNQGHLFFGGNHSIQWMRYQTVSKVLLDIPNGTPYKQTNGTAIYVGQDLDVDGVVGSITNKIIFQAVCNVRQLAFNGDASFLLFETNCQLGIWNETKSFGVHYN